MLFLYKQRVKAFPIPCTFAGVSPEDRLSVLDCWLGFSVGRVVVLRKRLAGTVNGMFHRQGQKWGHE